jgi:hypothetical protein
VNRFIRWLLSMVSTISVVLCAASVALWFYNQRHNVEIKDHSAEGPDGKAAAIQWNPPRLHAALIDWHIECFTDGIYLERRELRADPGCGLDCMPEDGVGLEIYAALLPANSTNREQNKAANEEAILSAGGWLNKGFGFSSGPDRRYQSAGLRSRVDRIQLPYWPLVILFALIPLVRAARRLKRWLRLRPGCCSVCGYDLRATPDRCPECGAEPAKLGHTTPVPDAATMST